MDDHRFLIPYSIVERSLAATFNIPPAGLGALRGRLKNYQRLGLNFGSPGSGSRLEYSQFDVYDWGFALALAEFGVNPSEIVTKVQPGLMYKLFGARNIRVDSVIYACIEFADFSKKNIEIFFCDKINHEQFSENIAYGFINVSSIIRSIDSYLINEKVIQISLGL